MATEAQRAPRVVARGGSSAFLPQAVLPSIADEAFAGLRVFDAVPRDCDVVPIRSHVAVYSRGLGSDGLVEGGIYVYESQRPVSPQYDARRVCTRKVVRIYRNTKATMPSNCWWVRDLDRPLRPGDGPFYDFVLAELLIGCVIGIYSAAVVQVAA